MVPFPFHCSRNLKNIFYAQIVGPAITLFSSIISSWIYTVEFILLCHRLKAPNAYSTPFEWSNNNGKKKMKERSIQCLFTWYLFNSNDYYECLRHCMIIWIKCFKNEINCIVMHSIYSIAWLCLALHLNEWLGLIAFECYFEDEIEFVYSNKDSMGTYPSVDSFWV